MLEGRFGRVEKLDAAHHGADLWDAVKGHDRIWTYIGYGPFPNRAAFSTWLAEREKLADPFSFAVVDTQGHAQRHRHLDGNPPGAAA